MLKFSKVVTFFSRLKQVGLTLSITYHLVPFLFNLFGMVIIIFFMFATVGMSLFGGYTNSTTKPLYDNKLGGSMTEGYWFVNFNDFPNTVNMLFVNVIGNNWIFFCLFSILSEDDSRTNLKWYFVLFQLITNLVLMNILIGFIIDNITSSFNMMNEQAPDESKRPETAGGGSNVILSVLSPSKRNNPSVLSGFASAKNPVGSQPFTMTPGLGGDPGLPAGNNLFDSNVPEQPTEIGIEMTANKSSENQENQENPENQAIPENPEIEENQENDPLGNSAQNQDPPADAEVEPEQPQNE